MSKINDLWVERFPRYRASQHVPHFDEFSTPELLILREKRRDLLFSMALPLVVQVCYDTFYEYWNAPNELFEEIVLECEAGAHRAIDSWNPTHKEGRSLPSWIYYLARQRAWKFLTQELEWRAHRREVDFETMESNRDSAELHKADELGQASGWGADLSGGGMFDYVSSERDMEAKATIQMLKKRLGDTDGRILDMLVEGCTQTEIASELGMTDRHVRRRIASLKEYIRETE